MSNLKWVDVVSGAAAGGAGISTATGKSIQSIAGKIYAVAVTFSGTAAPATTDITVQLLGSGGMPAQNLIVLTNVNTVQVIYPRKVNVDAANAVITGSFDSLLGSGLVQIDVAQADVGTIVSARVYYE